MHSMQRLISICLQVYILCFVFSKWAEESNSFEITSSCFVLLWMTVFVFLLCEPGARMTNQFGIFSDDLSRCDWHLLSLEMRRNYVIFLTQRSANLLSYATITCERETSKKVCSMVVQLNTTVALQASISSQIINTVFSYFKF